MAFCAAIHAAIRTRKGSPHMQDLLLFDVTPFFICLETTGERGGIGKSGIHRAVLIGASAPPFPTWNQ
eukprot:820659-Karenia_brevis.AAC.1